MAQALILDSEAVNAFARASRRSVLVERSRAIARRAGALLARAGLGSDHAIDAFVVATAAAFAPALIATGDPDDLGRLSSRMTHVHIFAI